MVEKASEDYSKLLQSVTLDKEINPICISIEDMLTRLDELESLLHNVRGENNIIMDQYANSILAFTPHFERLKERIDQLEHFLEVINVNVEEVKKSIDIAEEELNVTNFSIKGLLFKPLLAKAKSVSEVDAAINTNLEEGNFQAVPIFSTSEFFNAEVS